MNTDKVVELKVSDSNTDGGFVKLYARGKVGLLFGGSAEHLKIAEECFKRALNIQVTVDDIRFARAMRDRGVTRAAIKAYLETCSVIDEVHLGGLSLQ